MTTWDVLAEVEDLDVSAVIDGLLPSLHASTRGDLVFWEVSELFAWADEGLVRLAALTPVWVGHATTMTVAGQAQYADPPLHLSTLMVSLDDVTLRPGNQRELEARDPDYRTVQGTPDHWYADLLGPNQVALTPVPDSEKSLSEIFVHFPAQVTEAHTTVSAPAPMAGYIAMYILQEAYGREGQMEAQDIAQHCQGMVELYDKIFVSLWGKSL